MHSNDLPEFILVNIFHWCCKSTCFTFTYQCNFNTWIPKLELLKVCRMWRKLALPIVHKESAIMFMDSSVGYENSLDWSDDDYDSDNSNQSNGIDSQAGIYLVKSSLDILDIRNAKAWPRKLQICMNTEDAPTFIFQELIQKIWMNREYLERLKTVDIYFGSFGKIFNDPNSIAEASILGKEFCQLVPSVQHINLPSMGKAFFQLVPPMGIGPTAYEFIKSMIKSYAHTLKGITCPHWALDYVSSLSLELTHLILSKHGNTMHMPKMCADSLEFLSLSYSGNNRIWSCFESESNPDMLSFSNLKTLILTITIYRDEDELYFAHKFGYRIFAPRLEKLFIQLYPYTLSMLASIQGPSVIRYVEFTSDEEKLSIFRLNLDKARILFSSYAKGNHGRYEDTGSSLLINDIISIDGMAECTKLCCRHQHTTHIMEIIDWKYLNELDIHYTLKITDLPMLLLNAPRLKRVHIRDLELLIDGSIAKILGPEAVVEPIESEIRMIYVGLFPSSKGNNVDKVKTYLSKLLPNSEVYVRYMRFYP